MNQELNRIKKQVIKMEKRQKDWESKNKGWINNLTKKGKADYDLRCKTAIQNFKNEEERKLNGVRTKSYPFLTQELKNIHEWGKNGKNKYN